MRRLLGVLIVGATALIPGAVLVAPASAATTYVVGTASASCANPDYSTIADAVAAASDGDTIKVCAGGYLEPINDQGKDLTFLGVQAGVAGEDRSDSSDESFIESSTSFLVLTGASTVDGFRLTVLGSGLDTGAELAGHEVVRNNRLSYVHIGAEITGPDVVFEGNDVNIPDNSYNWSTIGVNLPAGGGANAVIKDNIFHGTLMSGAVAINQDASPADVSGVTISGNTVDAEHGHFVLARDASNLTITNNSVSADTAQPLNMVGLGGGDNGFTISGNTFNGPRLAASTAGGSSASGTVTGNTFTNNSTGYFSGAATGTVTLTSNIFRGAQTAAVSVEEDSTAVAHSNVFESNQVGVQNAGTDPIDATDNFWGCNTGPDTSGCATTDGPVTGSPFLVLSSSVGSHSVPVGQSTTFTANLNHNNDGALVTPPVIDGLAVHFSYDKGTVAPADWSIVAGRRSTTVHPTTTGGGTVTATVLNATTSQSVNSFVPPRISVRDAGIDEGNSGTHPLRFTVALNHRTSLPTTVRFTTANGSATAGSDFVAKSGTLTIPAGQLTGTVAVSVKGDRIREPDETLALNVYAPSIGTIADPVGTGVIRNDD